MKTILTSPRFWLLLVTALLQVLVIVKIIDTDQGQQLIQTLQVFILGIVAIRTIDKQAENKSDVTTVSMPAGTSSVTAKQETNTPLA